MKKITILVGFEATEETINSMSAGAMVELKRELPTLPIPMPSRFS